MKNNKPSQDLKGIDSTLVHKKKLVKNYNKSFEHYRIICRLKVTNRHSEYNKLIKQILKSFVDSCNNPVASANGNTFIIMGILESYFDFLKQAARKVSQIQDEKLLNIYQDVIFEKLEELNQVFKENIRNPISYDEFQRIINNEKKEMKSETGIQQASS